MDKRLRALISDIHANIEALTVVMDDIQKRGVEVVYCLGDVIGYGPSPRECIDMIQQKSQFTLCGNHEEAVLFNAEDFNPKARRAIDWTREQLNSEKYERQKNNALWDFLGELRKRVREDGAMYVHASPRQPTREYVLPKDVKDRAKLESIFQEFDTCEICFVGHTHIPGVFTDDFQFRYARQLDNRFELGSYPGKKLINVGSVGQPRDGDNRSCYVLFDGTVVEWVRLSYDYQKTMDKIRQVEDLADYLAVRLEEGR
jgi:diadenosine tetraphosphatase ApaH/serine/threonine PP2A family protein phosphatase